MGKLEIGARNAVVRKKEIDAIVAILISAIADDGGLGGKVIRK